MKKNVHGGGWNQIFRLLHEKVHAERVKTQTINKDALLLDTWAYILPQG